MDARSAFEAEVRPGDFVVCGSDYAQMLAGELGVAHTRERVLSDAEIVQRADVTVDLAPRPETLPPLRGKPADVKPAAPATPAVHAHEPEPVTERESLIPRRKSGK